MRPGKLYRTRVLAFATGYLLIVLGHLFPAPDFGSGVQRHQYLQKGSREKSTQLIYNLIRTDRCRFNENKTAPMRQTSTGILTGIKHSYTLPGSSRLTAFNSAFLTDRHFSYLNNRTLRI
ncbi:MAG: hypothetical protein JSU01_22265 [Bacteroidetes bacterium]|nr:hypothetical protein [Bacteroidota bacterium]